MTKFQFRLLLAIYAFSLGASTWLGLAEIGYSQQLVAAYAKEPEPLVLSSPLAFVLIVSGLLGVSLAGLLGMFLFKTWGRSLSLWSSVALLLLIPFIGESQSAPLEDFFSEIATLSWGAALALSYFSSIKDRFGTSGSLAPARL